MSFGGRVALHGLSALALSLLVALPAAPAGAIDPSLTLSVCQSGAPLRLPSRGGSVRVTGEMHGQVEGGELFSGYCAGHYADEAHFCVEVRHDGTALALELTDGGGHDTTLALVPGSPGAEGDDAMCDDDGGQGLLSRLEVTLDAGVYAIYVGTFGPDVSSTFALEVTRP